MAKLVLVRFESDEQADRLVEALNEEGTVQCSTPGWVQEVFGKAVGAFKVPTQFCECPPEKRDTSQRSSRGKKFGWWIRGCCGKPAKKGGLRPYNLLVPVTKEKPRYKQKYGVFIDGYFD